MENLHTAILFVSLTAAALTLAEGLLPEHKFERHIRLIFAAVLLTVMLKPLADIRPVTFRTKLRDSEAETEDMTALAEQAREQAVCESIKSSLNQELALREIPCEVTAVSAHISEDGSIVISEVAISGNRLTGSVALHEWLGSDIRITEGEN